MKNILKKIKDAVTSHGTPTLACIFVGTTFAGAIAGIFAAIQGELASTLIERNEEIMKLFKELSLLKYINSTIASVIAGAIVGAIGTAILIARTSVIATFTVAGTAFATRIGAFTITIIATINTVAVIATIITGMDNCAFFLYFLLITVLALLGYIFATICTADIIAEDRPVKALVLANFVGFCISAATISTISATLIAITLTEPSSISSAAIGASASAISCAITIFYIVTKRKA